MESEFPATNRTERGEGFAGAFPEFAGYIDDQIDAACRAIAAAGEEGTERAHAAASRLEIDGER